MPLRCQWLWRLSEQCSGSCECCRRDWLRYVRACRNSSRPRCACVSGALHRLCIPRRHRAVSASSRWTLASLLSPAASTGRRVIAQTSAAAMLLFVTFGASGNSRMCSITAAMRKGGRDLTVEDLKSLSDVDSLASRGRRNGFALKPLCRTKSPRGSREFAIAPQ